LDTLEVERLFDAESHAVYVPSGYLGFVRQGILLAQRFNANSLQVDGEPIKVVSDDDSSTVARAVPDNGNAFTGQSGQFGRRPAGRLFEPARRSDTEA
jgi:hypothetical protein